MRPALSSGIWRRCRVVSSGASVCAALGALRNSHGGRGPPCASYATQFPPPRGTRLRSTLPTLACRFDPLPVASTPTSILVTPPHRTPPPPRSAPSPPLAPTPSNPTHALSPRSAPPRYASFPHSISHHATPGHAPLCHAKFRPACPAPPRPVFARALAVIILDGASSQAYLLHPATCNLHSASCSLLTAHCSLNAARYPLRIAHCSLLAVC